MFEKFKRRKSTKFSHYELLGEKIYSTMNMAGDFLSQQMMAATLFGKEDALKKDYVTVLSFAYGVLDSFGQAFNHTTEECVIGAPTMIAHAMEFPASEFERTQTIAMEMIKCSDPHYGRQEAVLAGGKAVHSYLNAENAEEAREKTITALADIL